MKIYKKFILLLSVVMLITSLQFPVTAESFTRIDEADSSTLNVISREAYTAEKKIKASDYGLEENFEKINDIYCADNGEIFILCGESSVITVLNSDYTLNRTITVTDEQGVQVDFPEAKGIYVIDEKIYLCDTQNSQILVLDMQGFVKERWLKPESSLIPDNFVFQPTTIQKDPDGYFYVLSFGCFYGALTYSPEGEFIGFYGSNRVKATALDTLAYLWDLLTSNDEKKSLSAKTLPYSFVDFCFDNGGYMITCTGSTGGVGTGQISKISPGGSVILFHKEKDGKFVSSESVNFLEKEIIKRFNAGRAQNIVSIAVDSNGYMYALENTYGLIYVYDEECNLITAFGGGIGEGVQKGLFQNPTSIALNGEDVLVSDAETASITVFSPTDYGKTLMLAQRLYLNGDYEKAQGLWEEVLASDRGNQLAYRGLAMASHKDGDYKKALEYAEIGLDYNVYDLAYQQLFKNFIADNFIWFFVGAIALITGAIVLVVKLSKRETSIIKNVKIKAALSASVHPFRTFEEIKYKKLGSVVIACVITALFYISRVLEDTASGFLFTDVSQREYNTLFTIAQTIGLILLWSVMNWLISTLFEGKGVFAEVFTASAYALIPLILYTFLRVISSHFLPLVGRDFIDAVYVIVLMYTFYLLSIAMMATHEFTFPKFLLTFAVSVFGMFLVIFIVFMIAVLLQQFWDFIYAIYMELAFR